VQLISRGAESRECGAGVRRATAEHWGRSADEGFFVLMWRQIGASRAFLTAGRISWW
jgi:hypothetical protein